MGNSNQLEQTVLGAEPLYRRTSIFGRLYHSHAVRFAAVSGSVFGLTAVGVHFLNLPEAGVAGTLAQTNYGLQDGFWDGLCAPVNLALEPLLGKSIATDNSGIASSPADAYYPLGFGAGIFLWKLVITDILRSTFKKN